VAATPSEGSRRRPGIRFLVLTLQGRRPDQAASCIGQTPRAVANGSTEARVTYHKTRRRRYRTNQRPAMRRKKPPAPGVVGIKARKAGIQQRQPFAPSVASIRVDRSTSPPGRRAPVVICPNKAPLPRGQASIQHQASLRQPGGPGLQGRPAPGTRLHDPAAPHLAQARDCQRRSLTISHTEPSCDRRLTQEMPQTPAKTLLRPEQPGWTRGWRMGAGGPGPSPNAGSSPP